ncbi:MAG TPA: CBS domain-containing protein [Gaiellaceae bacterium]
MTTSTSSSRPLATTSVAQAMTTGVINCPPETSLRGVARLMTRNRVHAVYVFDYGIEDDETVVPWGLVSDLDLVAAARGDFDRTARDASVTPLVTVSASDTLDHAAQLMSEYGVSHLAVVDPTSGHPVGVVSTLDLARELADEPPPSR